jgi:hypothetical protein
MNDHQQYSWGELITAGIIVVTCLALAIVDHVLVRKLQAHLDPKKSKKETTAKDALNYLAQAAKAEMQVDRGALKEQGITDEQTIRLGDPYEKGSLPYAEPIEKAIWWVLQAMERDSDNLSPSPIEYIVDGMVVRVSTHDRIQAYIKARPSTAAPRESSSLPDHRRCNTKLITTPSCSMSILFRRRSSRMC